MYVIWSGFRCVVWQELISVQESRGTDLEKLTQLETSVGTLQADKAVLQVDLNTLR